MGELKKRVFTLELLDEEAAAFFEQCYADGTTPDEVLTGFICDLTQVGRTNGSDERDYAQTYYRRCGYGYFYLDKRRTFAQWLLYDFTMEVVEEYLDDLREAEEDIRYFTEHPEDANDYDLVYAKENKAEAEEGIAKHYQEYARHTDNPETLEEGLKGVREYLDKLKSIEEGGEL